MSEMLDYKILRSEIHSTDDRKGAMESAIAKLEKQVRACLIEGWEPLGGVAAEHMLELHVYAYSQAMVNRRSAGLA